MQLYLDSLDEHAWRELIPTGLFKGITTNPGLGQAAGLIYAELDWPHYAVMAQSLGAGTLCVQLHGPEHGYLEMAHRLAQLNAASDLQIVIKIPASEAGFRVAAAIRRDVALPILITAVYTSAQASFARAIDAEYIAPYLGRMQEAGMDVAGELRRIVAICAGHTSVMAASLRDMTQVEMALSAGVDAMTLSPYLARLIMSDPRTIRDVERFENQAFNL